VYFFVGDHTAIKSFRLGYIHHDSFKRGEMKREERGRKREGD